MPLGAPTARRAPTVIALALVVTTMHVALADAAAGAPRSLRAPRITGHAVSGADLRVSHGVWTGRPRAFRYAWFACDATGRQCRTRRGARAPRYRLGAADVGHRMRARVTASRPSAGRTLTTAARSAPTKRVLRAPALVMVVPGLGTYVAEAETAGLSVPSVPAGAPAAPTGVTATAGDASAQVSWSPPPRDGGSAITGYRITPYAGADAQSPLLVAESTTTRSVSGLTNGTSYTFRVAAVNAAGTGPDSAPSLPVTPVASSSKPVPMPLISRGVPAYASGGCGDPRAAADANYDTRWDCPPVPSAAAPDWLAYDLSGVPPAHRTRVVVAWFNDPVTSQFDRSVTGDPAYNLPRDYAIEVNQAPGGGGAPTTGWTRPVPAVTANTFNSRQQVVDMSGANWVRLLVTKADGQAQNNHVVLDMDVHDASAGVTDDWIFYGDSITQDGMSHDTRTPTSGPPVGSFSQLVNASKPAFYPVFQNGGIGGLTSVEGASHVPNWLTLFPGRYVALNYGTNDALTASPGDPSIAARFHANMRAMVESVLAAGKVPIVPTIPWGSNANLQANVPVLNDEVAKLKAEIPEIVAGPDLYGYFHDHPSLIGDGVHPTWDAGYAAMRRLWAECALALYP